MRVDAFDFDLPNERIALRPARPRDAARMLVVDGGEIVDAGSPTCRLGSVPAIASSSTIRASSPHSSKDDAVKPRSGRRCTNASTFAAGRRSSATPSGCASARASISARGSKRWPKSGCPTAASSSPLPATSRSRFCSNAPARCRCRPISPASVRPTTRTAPITRRCSRAKTARSRRRPPRCTSRPACSARSQRRAPLTETLTLHVGAGTFLPVKADDTEDHVMHAEWGRIDADTAARLNAVRANGGRVIAVGTTSLRLLESAAKDDGTIGPRSRATPRSSSPRAIGSRRSTA